MTATLLVLAVMTAAYPGYWLTYHNPATGLSFRYPADLRVRERNPRDFGLPKAEEITELLGDTPTNPATVVLRFIVDRGQTTAESATERTEFLQRVQANEKDPRQNIVPIQLDSHTALTVTHCGHSACHWTVEILQPRVCKIVSLISEPPSEGLPPPHDGMFPLLSIIQTVHFKTPAS